MNRRVPLCLLAAALALPPAACRRPPPPPPVRPAPASSAPAEAANPAPSAPPDFAVDAVQTREGLAVWYDVPENSLPQRRAWTQELTAASDALPLNSYARVRRLGGGGPEGAKPIVVRITDRGVHHPGALVDVSREAAQALGMVKTGEIRVRVEQLALRNATADKPVERKESPAAPKASEVSGTPAVSQQTEKAASDAKATPGR